VSRAVLFHAGFLVALVAFAGCASGPRARVVSAASEARIDDAIRAYEDFAAREGEDLGLFAEVAGAVLLSAGCGDDPALASMAARELMQAGLSGRPLLAEIIHRDCLGSFDATVLLARRGDPDARRLLRGMADNPSPEVRAAAVIALDPEPDRAMLLAWATDPDEGVRAAANERLGALGPSDADAFSLLTQTARNDASPRVRAHAVRALGSYEGAAFPALRERLSDPESSVRMAAVEALVRADRDRARGTLLDLLATPPSAESIEAARVLISLVGGPSEAPSEDDRTASLAYLRASLAAATASLRAQAAVVLVGLPGRDDLSEVLRSALGRETDPTARLSMARALLRRENAATDARAALLELMPGGEMTGLQAAVVLSEEGVEAGLEIVRSVALGDASPPNLRVIAVHALGRARPGELLPAFSDPDPSVRLAAAGAVLGRR
jgi:HEAT repeat protein